jgi:hypothetical protein
MAFSINIYLRLVLIAVGIIGGVVMWATLGVWYGIWFLLAGIILLIGYLLLGTVQSAAEKMQTMDFDGVEKRLGLTLSTKLLYKTNRAYYFFLKGTVAMNRNDTDEAERYFLLAESAGMSSDTEKAMIQFQLASIHANKNNWTAAQLHFKNAKQYKVTEPQLKEQMNQFEKALKQRGMIKMGGAAQRSQGFMHQQGGKRRRPKMR